MQSGLRLSPRRETHEKNAIFVLASCFVAVSRWHQKKQSQSRELCHHQTEASDKRHQVAGLSGICKAGEQKGIWIGWCYDLNMKCLPHVHGLSACSPAGSSFENLLILTRKSLTWWQWVLTIGRFRRNLWYEEPLLHTPTASIDWKSLKPCAKIKRSSLFCQVV